MNFLIAGATGLIGQQIVNELLKDKTNYIIILTRNEEQAKNRLPLQNKNITFTDYKKGWKEDKIDIILNLAGTPIASKPWTKNQKKKIINSRLLSTDYIYIRCLQNKIKPKLWITFSATGYYGNCGSEEVTEETVVSPTSFLQSVTDQVENNSKKISNIVNRHCVVRIGIVLVKKYGLLASILPFFKWNIGGKIGKGDQYVPWVHLDDVTSALLYIINNEKCTGVYNVCTPNPSTNKDFCKALSKTLHRINFLTIPNWVIKLFMGGRSELITSSQCASPKRLTEDGFKFKHPDLDEALDDILNKQKDEDLY